MRLTLAEHTIDELTIGTTTELVGSRLRVDLEDLHSYLLEDRRLESVDMDLVNPGDKCRAGYVFDIVEPRAKEPGSGADFPGILGPFIPAGRGTTHVLTGAAVTVVDGGQPGGEHGFVTRRGGMCKILEMSGPASDATPYGKLRHLVLVPHPFANVERHAVLNALRLASVKASVYLAKVAVGKKPPATQVFDLSDAPQRRSGTPPRVVYIGQVHGHQHGTEVDEAILYGGNTQGMMAVPMHPNEWLDGAVVVSYSWGMRGLETYFHQNHPIINELFRLHQAGEIIFAGTIATSSAILEEELARNSMMAAHLAKWSMGADGAILTKYVGGAPHADMFETARRCEELGIKTVIQASSTAPDGRAESALLMTAPGVDAVVTLSEGEDMEWHVPLLDQVIAGNLEVEAELAGPMTLTAAALCGACNNQGASRLQPILY